jgi:hypothetical protein
MKKKCLGLIAFMFFCTCVFVACEKEDFSSNLASNETSVEPVRKGTTTYEFEFTICFPDGSCIYASGWVEINDRTGKVKHCDVWLVDDFGNSVHITKNVSPTGNNINWYDLEGNTGCLDETSPYWNLYMNVEAELISRYGSPDGGDDEENDD